MKNCKFRGKDTQGQWYYGSLIKNVKGECAIVPNKIRSGAGWWKSIKATPVVTDSVGQYIGRDDHAGECIFSGDIIKNGLAGVWVVQQLEHGSFSLLGVCRKYNGRYFDISALNANAQVIGNIVDNREMLKMLAA